MKSRKYGKWKSKMTFPRVDDCIFLDIETDLSAVKIWMIGVKFKGKITQFLAKGPSDEKEILMKFADYLEVHPNYPLVCYSTTNFDFRVLWNASVRLNISKFQKFLKGRALIDLGTLLRRHFKPYGGSYSLKMLRFLLGFKYGNIELSGADVSTEYYILCKKYGELSEEIKETSLFKEQALQYNRDDVNILEFILNKFNHQIDYSDNFTKQLPPGQLGSMLKNKVYSYKIANSYVRISVRNEDFASLKVSLLTRGLPVPIEKRGKNVSAMYWSSRFGYEMATSLLDDLNFQLQ